MHSKSGLFCIVNRRQKAERERERERAVSSEQCVLFTGGDVDAMVAAARVQLA